MGYIDLHVHSNASDGTLTPEEIIKEARSIPLHALALTDHDTVAGIQRAIDAANTIEECQTPSDQCNALEIIPGIELSCFYQGTEIHLLGLYIDYHCEELLAKLDAIQTARSTRNKMMIDNFQTAGINLQLDDLTNGNPDTVITRAHFAKALVNKGYVTSMKQAFSQYLSSSGRYFVPKKELSDKEAMHLLTISRAFPVLAHPLLYNLGYRQIEQLIHHLMPLGLKGIEVYHSSNNQYESGKLKEMAVANHLLPTGGSDFHGSNKPDLKLGFGRGKLRVSHLLLDDIKTALSAPPM